MFIMFILSKPFYFDNYFDRMNMMNTMFTTGRSLA